MRCVPTIILDSINTKTNVPRSMPRLIVLIKIVRRKSANKYTENIADMNQNADSKVKVHVNLGMELNCMRKRWVVTMKKKSNLYLN